MAFGVLLNKAQAEFAPRCPVLGLEQGQDLPLNDDVLLKFGLDDVV